MLLDAGASAHVCNRLGDTPLDVAARFDRLEVGRSSAHVPMLTTCKRNKRVGVQTYFKFELNQTNKIVWGWWGFEKITVRVGPMLYIKNISHVTYCICYRSCRSLLHYIHFLLQTSLLIIHYIHFFITGRVVPYRPRHDGDPVHQVYP